jgi:hypothetical protein
MSDEPIYDDSDWPDVMALVAQMAAKDGLRLTITDGPDGEPLYCVTDEPEESHD